MELSRTRPVTFAACWLPPRMTKTQIPERPHKNHRCSLFPLSNRYTEEPSNKPEKTLVLFVTLF